MSINMNIPDYVIPLAIIIITGIATFFLSLFLLKRLFRKLITKDEYEKFKHGRINIVAPLLISLVIVYVLVTAFFNFAGDDVEPAWGQIISWLSQHGVVMLLTILAAYILSRLFNLTIPSAMHHVIRVRAKDNTTQAEIDKRTFMLSHFLIHTGEAIVIIIAAFIILSEFGIDIAPMLAGAGVVGLAVGLGAQKFIGDLINGICITLEDYYSVGDVVKVAGISGLVEEVNIRRTILRDLDGTVHIIPNGEIKIASNLTRNWSRVNINIGVSYKEDLDRVITVMNRVGNELAQDEYFKDMIITAPQVLRVDNFADSAIEIKMMGDTKPIKQWEVTGELRKRIKKAFDEENIEIPWPHIKVYSGDK